MGNMGKDETLDNARATEGQGQIEPAIAPEEELPGAGG